MANYIYAAKALTGGAASALDNIDGATLADGDGAITFTPSYIYFHNLNATSGKSESPPRVISPDANAGNKRWEMVAKIGTATASLTTTSSTTTSSTTTTTAP